MQTHSFAQRGDEIFDVVNERNEVIGQAMRSEVHARGLRHRAVHVLVVGSDGRVFLQKRSMLKDSAPGCWDSSCSGHLDAGEDYLPAAVRELREEIGLAIAGPEVLTLVAQLEACEEVGWEFVRVYQLRADGPFQLHPAEIERGEWFTIEEIGRAIAERPAEFARSFRHIWSRVKRGVLSPARIL